MDNGDWENVRSVVHQLKGMGSSFGFPMITKLSGRAEKLLKIGNLEQAVGSISELLECIDQVVLDHSASVRNKKLGT